MVVCAELFAQGRPRHHAAPTAASASPSCSSPTAWATRCTSRWRWAAPAFSGPGRRRPRTCSPRSSATGRRCSSRCRPATACCSRRTAAFDLSRIRLAVSAGEALPPALYERFKQRFGIDILDGIGSTEALQMFISNRPGAIRPGSSGLLVPGYDARIVNDEWARRWRQGEIGNLWISGDSTCAGYWNQHEKTKDTIHGRWLRTGDKYTRDADGYFWYQGRSDDMLKVGGQWVSPVEVENALIEHPAVLECGGRRPRGSGRADQARGLRGAPRRAVEHAGTGDRAAAPRAAAARRLQAAALGRVPARAAEDADGEDPAVQAASLTCAWFTPPRAPAGASGSTSHRAWTRAVRRSHTR